MLPETGTGLLRIRLTGLSLAGELIERGTDPQGSDPRSSHSDSGPQPRMVP